MKRLTLIFCLLVLLMPTIAVAKTAKLKPDERRYKVTVAVPSGVYAKTKFFAVADGKLRQFRLTRVPPTPLAAGTVANFIGRERGDATGTWLSVPIASLVVSGTATGTTYSPTSTWPTAPTAVELTGVLTASAKGQLTIEAGSATGTIFTPSGTKVSYKIGDALAARGWATSHRELYLTDIGGLALVRPVTAATASASATSASGRVSGTLAGGLVALVGGFGLWAYFRNERLKRRPPTPFGEEKY